MASGAKAGINADDPRYQRSVTAIRRAVVHLLSAGPPSELTITELVLAAGVTRPTFYQHFGSVPEAARSVALAMLEDAFPIPSPISPEDRESPRRLAARIKGNAAPVILHLAERRAFYVHVLEGAGSAAFFEQIIQFLAERLLPEASTTARHDPQGDRMSILAGGLMWMVARWLRAEASEDAEHFAGRLAEAVVTLLLPAPRS